MKKRTLCVLALLTCLNAVYAQDFVTQLSYLSPSIRAMGMGGAITAIADAPNGFQNPAAFLKQDQKFFWSDMDQSVTQFDSFETEGVLIRPLGFSKTTIEKDDETLSYWSLGLGRRGGKSVTWGVLYRALEWDSESESGEGWTTDLGLQWQMSRRIQVGWVFQNLAKKDVPMKMGSTLGLAYTLGRKITFVVDYQVPELEWETSHVVGGVELNAGDGLVLRGGYNETGATFGTTLTLLFLKLNYAVQFDSKNPDLETNRVGIVLGRISQSRTDALTQTVQQVKQATQTQNTFVTPSKLPLRQSSQTGTLRSLRRY